MRMPPFKLALLSVQGHDSGDGVAELAEGEKGMRPRRLVVESDWIMRWRLVAIKSKFDQRLRQLPFCLHDMCPKPTVPSSRWRAVCHSTPTWSLIADSEAPSAWLARSCATSYLTDSIMTRPGLWQRRTPPAIVLENDHLVTFHTRHRVVCESHNFVVLYTSHTGVKIDHNVSFKTFFYVVYKSPTILALTLATSPAWGCLIGFRLPTPSALRLITSSSSRHRLFYWTDYPVALKAPYATGFKAPLFQDSTAYHIGVNTRHHAGFKRHSGGLIARHRVSGSGDDDFRPLWPATSSLVERRFPASRCDDLLLRLELIYHVPSSSTAASGRSSVTYDLLSPSSAAIAFLCGNRLPLRSRRLLLNVLGEFVHVLGEFVRGLARICGRAMVSSKIKIGSKPGTTSGTTTLSKKDDDLGQEGRRPRAGRTTASSKKDNDLERVGNLSQQDGDLEDLQRQAGQDEDLKQDEDLDGDEGLKWDADVGPDNDLEPDRTQAGRVPRTPRRPREKDMDLRR
ncbi:hypothetical protein BD626DRAFT_536866 [Schizophyllum amplum]|uniref:Uncharacterized protein n=1 Tax=Schizophyllum amplum TaxID=97359 RepID=A0A550CFA4_9AGAR|nr:hypothetical protein BD626DRAFT_536866 [Auriculariopsis ampla]